MIKSFLHKGLEDLFLKGTSAKVRPDFHARCLRRLAALDRAIEPEDLNIPSFNFHRLHGSPTRYTLHVNGPWCITPLNGKTTTPGGLIWCNITDKENGDA